MTPHSITHKPKALKQDYVASMVLQRVKPLLLLPASHIGALVQSSYSAPSPAPADKVSWESEWFGTFPGYFPGYFYLKDFKREGNTGKSSICWFTFQMAAMAGAQAI